MKRNKKVLLTIIALGVVAVSMVGCSRESYAGQGTGGGGGQGASMDGCAEGHHFNSGVCNNGNSPVGGASWHMFKTTNSWYTSGVKLNLYKGSGQPVYDTSVAPMRDGGYDKRLRLECPKNKYEYYFAFVYDGWDGRDDKGNMENVPTYWGPVRPDVYILSSAGNKFYPSYNSYGTHNSTDIKNGLANGTNMHGWRVGAAKQTGTILTEYNRWRTAEGKSTVNKIPDNIGYFCYAGDVTLTGYAKYYINGGTNSGADGHYLDANGNETTNLNNAKKWTKTVPVGKDADVSSADFNPEGYSWKYWGSSCKSGGEVDRKCTVSGLTNDKNIWGYYSRNSFSGRAYVAGGGAVGDTGYIQRSASVSANIDCPNSGCTANFDLSLDGSGSTEYRLYYPPSGGWIPGAGLVYIKNGSGSVLSGPQGMLPGQSATYCFTFKPYGSFGNDYWVDQNGGLCASSYAKVTNFEGKITLSGAASGSVGMTGSSNTKTVFINNCSPTVGCKVSFKHEMQRSGSIGSTDWTVSRESNMTDSARRITAGALGSGTLNSNGVQNIKNDNNLTLYPGMVVCEVITFKPSNDVTKTVDNASIKLCASALGNAQPDDPINLDTPEEPTSDPKTLTGGDAFVNIKVRNATLRSNSYYKWQREVYAKPGDELAYRATYNPVLQYTYYLKPQKMKINDNGGIVPGGTTINGVQLGSYFNSNRGSLKAWNNAFSIQQSKNNFSNVSLIGNHRYTLGLTTKQSPVLAGRSDRASDKYTVLGGDVGKSVDERAITSVNGDTQTTPSQVSFTNSNNYNLATVYTASKSKIAYARIPYNFITDVNIPNGDTDGVIGAGEEGSVGYNLGINPKSNTATTDNPSERYATRADEVKRQLVVYNPATVGKKNGGIMNGGRNVDICSGYFGLANNEVDCGYSSIVTENLEPGSHNIQNAKFYVQDKHAGFRICVAVAVFPANSGADKNWNDKNYSNSWQISNSKCYTITKKPSIQVWGGNMYTKGNINTAVGQKYSVAGYTGYKVDGSSAGNKKYFFGSWNELGVVASGMVRGFASAAATGYTRNNNGALWPVQTFPSGGSTVTYRGRGNNATPADPDGPGGLYNNSTSFCLRSRLTIPNDGCVGSSGGVAGTIGVAAAASRMDGDKEAVIAKLIHANPSASDSGTVVDATATIVDDKSYYYGGNSNDMTIGPTTLTTLGALKIVHSDKNLTISGNLEYRPAGKYVALREVPKLVLYAKNDVYIDCGVYRIDALIVAGGTVVTCNNLGEGTSITEKVEAAINDEANSNQLIVNGAIIADRLIPNRTYGAATGANSIIPAEIINFDPTLYLWASDGEDDDSLSGSLNASYTHELPPRR